jgi:hypothetical protein
MSHRPPRLLIAFDGWNWYIRRIKLVEHDIQHDEKVYRCDRPIGKPCATLLDAVLAVYRSKILGEREIHG